MYNASGNLAIDARVDCLSLHACGLTLDTIIEVLPICEEVFPTCVPLIKQSWRPSDPEGSYAPTGESLDQAFNRTLLAGRGNANLHIDSELRRGFAVNWTLVFGDTSTMSYKGEKKRYWMLLDLSRIITGRRFFGLEVVSRALVLLPLKLTILFVHCSADRFCMPLEPRTVSDMSSSENAMFMGL